MDVNVLIKNLLKKNASRIESIRLLRTLKAEIRKGLDHQIPIDEIKKIFNLILNQSALSECPSLIVRLYLASCFSDALYMYAPSIPLTTTGELDAVFQLFSTVLSSHYDEGSTESNIVQNIVEILNSTDSYLLIRNREVSCEIIESMIKIRPISNADSDQNFHNAVEFIGNLTNSITSQLLLQEILKLFAKNFNSSPLTQAVLPLLNQSNQVEIVNCFQECLNYSDFLKTFVKASKILNLSISFITQTLYPDIVNEDDSQRVNAFGLISQLFKQYNDDISNLSTEDSQDSSQDSPNLNLSTDSKCIKFILSRSIDKCPKIRLIIFQIAHDLIQNGNSLFLKDSLTVLKNISIDPNESIRMSGLDILWDLIQDYIHKYSQYPFHFNIHTSLFLNDKSSKIREKALLCTCELLHYFHCIKDKRNSIAHLDKIIQYCQENPGFEIFLAFSKLFEYFDSTDLYDLASDSFQFMKVLRYIKTTTDTMKKYIETSFLPSNNISKLFTKEIWKPNLRNTNLLKITGSPQHKYQSVLKLTNDQFAKEFCALTLDIPISIDKLLENPQKRKVKDFAFLHPDVFVLRLGEIIDHCVSVLPLLSFEETDDIFERLLDSNTEESLIVFSKLFSRSNRQTTVKVFDYNSILIFDFNDFYGEINYNQFTPSFKLKFFYYLSIPDVIPDSIFLETQSKDLLYLSRIHHGSFDKTIKQQQRSFLSFSKDNCSVKKNDFSVVKWSLRISFFFNVRDLISIHFYFIENQLITVLDSLFKISNVINDETTTKFCSFKVKRPKKKTNILSFLTPGQIRRIFDLYLKSIANSSKYQLISLIDEALKNPKTPIEFLSLLFLIFGHESKKKNDLYSKSRIALLYHLNLRRHFAPSNLNPKQKNDSVIVGQQIELMIPSVFNFIAFFSNDYQYFVDLLFDFVLTKSLHNHLNAIIQEIVNKVNSKSRFGNLMKMISTYALSKINVNNKSHQEQIEVNQKFLLDDGNNLT